MKKKSVITIISIFLNLVLFSALTYYDKINSHVEGVPAPFFHEQHLSDMQGDSHGVTLASAVK
jgi:hypothetical protein